MRTLLKQQRAFTLVEMIVVMVITGILGGMVAIFIKAPVQGYVDSARRAEMTDVADTALRRLARDIRTAVPNSLRMPVTACAAGAATPCYVEFLPTKSGGRYRSDTPGNTLNFGVADGSFDIVGSAVNFVGGAVAPDFVVIGSTQSSGNPPYDTTTAGILRQYTGATGAQTSVLMSTVALPAWAEVQGQRFDVVDGTQRAVMYGCASAGVNASGDGTGALLRYWNYGFVTPQVFPPALGVSAILADHVSACEINYDLVSQRNGLLAIRLGITRSGESVSLYQTIHVNNVP